MARAQDRPDHDPLDFGDATLRQLTSHEKNARSEIIEWRSSEDGTLQRVREYVQNHAGYAVRWATPSVARKTVEEAVKGGMEMVQDASRLTFSAGSVVEKAQSRGLEVESVADLAGQPLRDLDDLSSTYFMPNKLIAAGEGGACGFGGVGGAAADLPLLFGVACRAVQQVGTCYGLDMEDPDVRPVVLSIFSVGAGAGNAAKARFLADLHVAAQAFAKRWTYRKVAERTASGMGARVLKQMTRRMPRKIAKKVTKQKLAQSLPVVGAAIGAAFNYRFLSSTLRSARMAFRSLYLTGKYGDSGERGAQPVPTG